MPEDTWTRVARHWHECYRLSHPLPPGHPKSPARLPWPELDPFLRQDNILELRSILSAVAARGRQWTPVHLVPAGQRHRAERGGPDGIAIAEHTRWQQRGSRPAGQASSWSPGRSCRPHARASIRGHLRSQLAQLEDVGFVPIVPAGGPPAAARFERVGLVRASQLSEPLAWTTHAGEQMHGFAGRLAGHRRRGEHADGHRPGLPVEPRAGRRRPLAPGRQRTGPGRSSEAVVVRTKEGKATARPGDWVVEAPTGERWPVRDEQFGWSYRPSGTAPDLPAFRRPGEHAPRPTSSSTAPTISS